MTQTRKTRGPRAVPMDPDRILDAAQEVFAGQGLEGASIRAIALKTGCDPKLLYYHFPNKEELFLTVLKRGLSPVLTQLLAVAGSPASTAERLWQVLRIYHDHLVDNAGLRQMLRGEIAGGTESIRDGIANLVRPVLQTITGIIQDGVRRGELRPDLRPPITTFFLVRMQLEILDLLPAMSLRIVGIPAAVALPMAEREWFRTFWRGVAARPDEPLSFLDPLLEIRP